jgi:hypothetical protein
MDLSIGRRHALLGSVATLLVPDVAKAAFIAPSALVSRNSPGGIDPFTLPNIYSAWTAGRGMVLSAGSLVGWLDSFNIRHFGAIGGGVLSGTFLPTGGPNGIPCVSMNGTSDRAVYSTGSLAQPSHIFLVAKYNSAGSAGTLIDATAGNTAGLHRVGATSMQYNAGGAGVVCANCTPLSWHLHEVFFSGASSFYKEDGVLKGSGDGGSASAGRFVLGAYGDTVLDPGPVSIAEAWAFSAQVTGTNLGNFKGYMTAKTALALT